MKVRFKRGWLRTYGTLTPGNVYRVIGIECNALRIMDDTGEPTLFAPQAFDFVDPTEPADWISKHGDKLERYAGPAELAEPGFFEDWHDGDRGARSKLSFYLHGISWRQAETQTQEESANTYLCVRWKHEERNMPVLMYVELDESRWEVRKVEVFVDGRMSYADGKSSSGETVLGEEPAPALEEIAASPEFEPMTISRSEFESVWEKAAYSGLDE
jgi:hypothetical protein